MRFFFSENFSSEVTLMLCENCKHVRILFSCAHHSKCRYCVLDEASLNEYTFIWVRQWEPRGALVEGDTGVLVLTAQANHFPGNTSEEAAPLRVTLLRSQSPSAVQIKEPNHYQHHKLGNPLTTTRRKGGTHSTCTDYLSLALPSDRLWNGWSHLLLDNQMC